ncbi:chemotaxis-specific protein-glutamate methyltransferase CheB [bacterium]|nr:chemotaxis-specific protein-glutamate methyltransferase CheB [bacterium]
MIKILIAEDSPTVTMILQKIFAADDECQVIGTAKNGKEAVDKVKLLRPDIVTMDIRMPVMDGFEATKQIMTFHPTPILVISASVGKDDLNIAFNAIRAGALDIVEKPKGNLAMDYEYIGRDLIKKVKILSGVKVFHHVSGKAIRARADSKLASSGDLPVTPASNKFGIKTPSTRELLAADKRLYPKAKTSSKPPELVAIASSTGGPSALLKILKNLPDTFQIPIVIVQHICEGFGQGFVDWLNKECNLNVKTAERGEVLTQGNIYVAPDGFHLLIDPGKVVRLSKSMPINGLRPCATLMMETAAKVYGGATIGVILTGMGRDGADGMKAIKDAGGLTIAQSPETCVVFGMPKEAIELGVVDKILPIERIANDLEYVTKMNEIENAN